MKVRHVRLLNIPSPTNSMPIHVWQEATILLLGERSPEREARSGTSGLGKQVMGQLHWNDPWHPQRLLPSLSDDCPDNNLNPKIFYGAAVNSYWKDYLANLSNLQQTRTIHFCTRKYSSKHWRVPTQALEWACCINSSMTLLRWMMIPGKHSPTRVTASAAST